MSLRPALLAAAAIAITLWATFVLCRGGKSDLSGLARAVQHGQELDSHLEGGRRRDEARRALAAEVVVGRMSLREATEHFRRLDEANPLLSAKDLPLPGNERPPGENVMDWVWAVFARQQRFAAAARWYADTFTAHPHLLLSRPSWHRYHAACFAALAADSQGLDAADLDEKTRVRFRRQARVWLRAELEARQRLLEQEAVKALAVAPKLQDWPRNNHLAGVRGPEALARLPAAERQAWQTFWADVADTLARAEGMIRRQQRAANRILAPER
jgi:hypothetical protein